MSLLSRLDRVRNKDADIKDDEVSLEEGAANGDDGLANRTGADGDGRPDGVPSTALSTLGSGAPTGAPAARPSLTKISGGTSEVQADGSGSSIDEVVPPRVENNDTNRLYNGHKYMIFDDVMGALDTRLLQQPQRDAVRLALEKSLDDTLRTRDLKLPSEERGWLLREFIQEVMGFGPLSAFLDDPSISKIIVNGSQDLTIERLGQLEHVPPAFRDDDHVMHLIRRIAEVVGGRIDPKVPLLDRPLPDGSRVRAKVPPLSPQPALTIEKSAGNPFELLRRQQEERQRGDAEPYAQLRERIQLRLVRDLEGNSFNVGQQDRLRAQVEDMINSVIQEERVALSRAEKASLIMEMLNEIVGLGPLEPLLNDPEVDEIMVNGPFQIYMERRGKLEISGQRFRDNAHIMQVIDRMVAPLGRRVDEKSPMVDGRLRDGSRFNVILPPLSLVGPTLTIRKFARDPYSMTDLVNFGTLTREAAQFLQAAVESRLNVVVSGGTGSGKTTTLNVLSSFIPSNERVVTIEDAAELQMRQEHVVRLETRPPNIEGIGEITIRDLVRNALRMRPDRIIVGECRGAEALDMLQAMNTGHDGSLTTLHANSARDMVKRLETMVLMAGFDLPVRAIREQISMAIQLVAHQERMRDGVRRISTVTEIFSMEGETITMQDIFRFEQEYVDSNGRIHGRLQPTGLRPKYYEQMMDAGAKLPLDLFQPKAVESTKPRTTERAVAGR